MAYRGNFVFDEFDEYSDDFLESNRDGSNPHCKCCKKPYIPGGLETEGDDRVPNGTHEVIFPPERTCNCSGKELREYLEKKEKYVKVCREGHRLIEWLENYEGLEQIDELDVCRMSEMAGKSFNELIEYPADELILLYVKSWSDHIKKKVEEGHYARV